MTTRPAGARTVAAPTAIPKSGWLALLRRALGEIKRDGVTDRAAALTYFGVLAIFPMLLVLVSILGMIGEQTTTRVLDNVGQIAPGGVTRFLHSVIDQVQGRAGAAGIAATVGILIAIWSASGYVAAFMRAMNAIYNIEEGRPIWHTVPVRLAVTIALLIMLVVSAVMVAVTGPVARQVGDAIGAGDAAVTTWNIAKWPVLLIIVCCMLSLLYWATPNVRQPGVRWIVPGGVLAVIVWLIVSGLFAVYVSFSGSYNKTYGSLATVIVFLVWLWLTNIAILLGAEFNSEAERQRMLQAGLPDEIEPYVQVRDTRKLDDAETDRVEHAAAVRRRMFGHGRRGRRP